MLGLGSALGLAVARRLPPPRLALFSFAVAGGFYHGLRRVRGLLTPGMLLDLRAEPSNPHDANAVEVLMPADGPHAGMKLGYLPRCGNRATALWLARGAVLRAEVVGTLGKRPGESIPDDLVFTSYWYDDPLLRLIYEGWSPPEPEYPSEADARDVEAGLRTVARGATRDMINIDARWAVSSQQMESSAMSGGLRQDLE
jgi:hypothetical protein